MARIFLRFSLILLLLLSAASVSAQPMGEGRLTYPGERWAGNYPTADALIARHVAAGSPLETAIISSPLTCTTAPATACTIPATLKLDFRPTGALDCENKTNAFVILSEIAPNKGKILNNCGSSSFTPLVSFAGNAFIATIPTRWFGDTGDGTTNDQPFIRDAILAATTLTNGGTVLVGAGVHNLTAQLVVWGNNLTLAGEGPSSVLQANLNNAIVTASYTNAVVNGQNSSHFSFRDFKVVNKSQTAINIDGGYIRQVDFDHLEFDLTAQTGGYGIFVGAPANTNITNSRFYGKGVGIGTAISVSNGGLGVLIDNNDIDFTWSGLQVNTDTNRDTKDIYITRNRVNLGTKYQQALVSATTGVFTTVGSDIVITDNNYDFTGKSNNFVRVLPVRQNSAGTITYNAPSTKIVDTGAKFTQSTDAAGACTSGTSSLTIGSSTFVAADVGKAITITDGVTPTVTTIAVFTSGTAVTLSGTCATNYSGATVTWGGVLPGDLVRSPTVSPTKWTVVQKVVSATELQVETWRDMATWQKTLIPANGITYTVYGLLFSRATSATLHTLTAAYKFNDWNGTTAAQPADGTLYELLGIRLTYPIFTGAGDNWAFIQGNTVRGADSDSIGAQGGAHMVISQNTLEDGQDIGMTILGANVSVLHNKIRHMGSIGIYAAGTDGLIEGNEITDIQWGAMSSASQDGAIHVRNTRISVLNNQISKGTITANSRGIVINTALSTNCYIAGNRTTGFDATYPGLLLANPGVLTGCVFGKNFFDYVGSSGAVTGGIFQDTGSYAYADLPTFAEDGSRLWTTEVDANCTGTLAGGTPHWCLRIDGAWVAETTYPAGIPAIGNMQVLSGKGANTNLATTTGTQVIPLIGSLAPATASNANDLAAAQPLPAGTLSNFTCSVNVAPGGAVSRVCTVVKSSDLGVNFTNTALTCTITSAITSCSDTDPTHADTVGTNDLYAVTITATTTTAAAKGFVSAMHSSSLPLNGRLDTLVTTPAATTTVTCAAGTNGTLFFDSDLNELCFCNGGTAKYRKVSAPTVDGTSATDCG